jgi:hypothetical protein
MTFLKGQAMRTLVFVAALIPCLVTARLAQAHIRLMSPTARYTQDDTGLKTAPCGSGTATGAPPTPLVPGQTLTVTWKESVSHAGHYRIALAASASDFTEPTSLDVPTTLPGWDLADGIQDKTGTQTYSQAVQIPNAECPTCVLQLLQIMSTGTDGTNTGPFSGVYHACADVSVSASNTDAGSARDAATAADARSDAGPKDGSDGSAVRLDTVQAAGGATGTGDSGGAWTGGSTAGTGGAISAGGSSAGGNSAGAGGSTSKSTGGTSGGGTSGGTAAGNGGSAGGEGGSIASSGGHAGGSGGNVASGGEGGSGGAASGGSGGNVAGAGGIAGNGGKSETQTAGSANGCSCQLGSRSGPGMGVLLSVLAVLASCFSLVRRRHRPIAPAQG